MPPLDGVGPSDMIYIDVVLILFMFKTTQSINKTYFMQFMNIPQLVAVLHCAMKRSLVAETSD